MRLSQSGLNRMQIIKYKGEGPGPSGARSSQGRTDSSEVNKILAFAGSLYPEFQSDQNQVHRGRAFVRCNSSLRLLSLEHRLVNAPTL